MNNEKDTFLRLIKEFSKDGQISEMELMILKEKAAVVGIDENSLNLLLEMEIGSPKPETEVDKVNNNNTSGINKVALLEALIKESARDGKIDEKETESIKQKAKELNISLPLVEEMLNKSKSNLFETKRVKLIDYSTIMEKPFFVTKEKIESLSQIKTENEKIKSLIQNKTEIESSLKLLNYEYIFYEYMAKRYCRGTTVDFISIYEYKVDEYINNILGKKRSQSGYLNDIEADELINSIETKYDLKVYKPNMLKMFFAGNENDKHQQKQYTVEKRLNSNLSRLREKIKTKEKVIENELAKVENILTTLNNEYENELEGAKKELTILNKELEAFRKDHSVHVAIRLKTDNGDFDFYSAKDDVEYIELKKNNFLEIKTKNILYVLSISLYDIEKGKLPKGALSFSDFERIEGYLKFHFGNKVTWI